MPQEAAEIRTEIEAKIFDTTRNLIGRGAVDVPDEFLRSDEITSLEGVWGLQMKRFEDWLETNRQYSPPYSLAGRDGCRIMS